MKYIKKRNNKKPLACALGVLLALAPSFCIYQSAVVPVYADDVSTDVSTFVTAFASALADANSTYYQTFENGDFDTLYSGELAMATVNSLVNSFYTNLKWAIDSNSEMNSNGSVYSGFYRVSGSDEIRTGQMFLKSGSLGSTVTLVSAQDFTIGMYADFGSNLQADPSNVLFNSSITASGYQYSFSYSGQWSFNCYLKDFDGFFSGTDRFLRATGGSFSDYIAFWLSPYSGIPSFTRGASISRSTRFLGSGSSPSLPELGSPMTKANAINYYNDLVDYIETTYPDVPITQIPFPTGYDPYNPEYPSPTDNYIGIPAEWTIENPVLPTSPTIIFDHHAPDLTQFHPLEDLANYADVVQAMSIWWALFEGATTNLHIFEFFYIFLALAIVGYILWYLGS